MSAAFFSAFDTDHDDNGYIGYTELQNAISSNLSDQGEQPLTVVEWLELDTCHVYETAGLTRDVTTFQMDLPGFNNMVIDLGVFE